MNTTRRIVMLLALVGTGWCSVTAAQAAEKAVAEEARKLALPFVESGYVQGMSIGLIKGDERITLHVGKVRSDGDAKPDDRTLYEIGSVSKTFTALLLAEEVTRGNLKLDTPVAELLPAHVKLPAGKDRGMTLGDLASHTSGLPRMPGNFTPKDKDDPYADYTLEQLYESLGQAKLGSEPGRLYLYSNLGATALGQALAHHLKQDYDALLRERIFKVLKMDDTATKLSAEQQKRFAQGHTGDGEPAKAWELNVFNPAGGIRSNMVDMMRYVEAQLGKRKSSLDEAITLSHEQRLSLGSGGIALGWHVSADKVTRWHNGQTGGYHSFVGFNTDMGIGVVILTNTGSGEVDRLGDQLIRMLAGKKEKPVTFAKVAQVDRKTLEKYVGTYAIVPAFQLTVTLRGDRLRVQATGQDAFTIYPESETRFNYRVTKAAITFDVDKDGNVNKLTLHQNGMDMPALRVKP